MYSKETMKKNQKKRSNISKTIHLTNLGLQMGITIFIASYFGKKIDVYYGFEKNWFAIGFSLLGVLVSLYWLIKGLKKLEE